MIAIAVARNNPRGSSFLVIQANRLRIGDAAGVAGVVFAPNGSFDIASPFQLFGSSTTSDSSPLRSPVCNQLRQPSQYPRQQRKSARSGSQKSDQIRQMQSSNCADRCNGE
jgi:hypothetical protein